MRLTLRNLAPWIAAFSVLAFGAASVASYRPGGATDRVLALDSLKRALKALDAENLDSAARLAAYRDGLGRTGTLLRGALRANPTDTTSIERLATVVWESGVLSGSPDTIAVSALMEIAASRAPRVKEIQVELGELAYRMGRRDEAARFMNRAVDLSPSMTNRAVAAMQGAGVTPAEIVRLLPPAPEVLIATRQLFMASGEGLDYLDHVEQRLADATPSLVLVYGEACLQLRSPERLKDRLIALPSTEDPVIHAERSCQIARAWLALGHHEQALEFANDARRLTPLNPRIVEFCGEVELASGRGANAEAEFRRAIELVVAESASPVHRARLYDALGRSLEAQGRPDFAYDAFRRAVALDPMARNAASRVAAYEHRSVGPHR